MFFSVLIYQDSIHGLFSIGPYQVYSQKNILNFNHVVVKILFLNLDLMNLSYQYLVSENNFFITCWLFLFVSLLFVIFVFIQEQNIRAFCTSITYHAACACYLRYDNHRDNGGFRLLRKFSTLFWRCHNLYPRNPLRLHTTFISL